MLSNVHAVKPKIGRRNIPWPGKDNPDAVKMNCSQDYLRTGIDYGHKPKTVGTLLLH